MSFFLGAVWLGWVIVSAAGAANIWLFRWQRSRQQRLFHEKQSSASHDSVCSEAVLIVCVKGFDEDLSEPFYRSLIGQKYARYRIILAVESDSDPAIKWWRENGQALLSDSHLRSRGLTSVTTVVAGHSTSQAQKLHNQIAAFQKLRESDDLIVFVDADVGLDPDWLTRLTQPIRLGLTEYACGHRYVVAGQQTLANHVASILVGVSSTIMRSRWWDMAWAGSMVMSRRLFDEMNVPSTIKGGFNDDVFLSVVAHRSGYVPFRNLTLFVESPVNMTWAKLWEFGVRQYFHFRHYSFATLIAGIIPGLYVTLGYATACVSAFFGNTTAIGVLLTAFGLDQVRAFGRRRLVQDYSPAIALSRQGVAGLLEHLATPFWMGLNVAMILRCLTLKSIWWGGIRYEVKGANETRVLDRAA